MSALETDWTEPAPFHLWVDDTVDPPCVRVSGEVDLLTCAALREALSDLAERRPSVIAIDLSRVVFMGSTGIRELVRVAQVIERVEVHAPRPIVRRALEAANLSDRVIVVG